MQMGSIKGLAPAAADGELRGDEWHMCVGVLGCVHLSARMHVRVCVSVFMHLCMLPTAMHTFLYCMCRI